MMILDDNIDSPGRKPPGGRSKNNSNQPLSRSERRIDAILKTATQVFFEKGYANTAIDDIVNRAGGSKATIYKHFKNKRELFNAVIDSVVELGSKDKMDYNNPDAAKALTAFAKRRVEIVFSRDHISLLRLVISEGPNSPGIAKTYYEHGPGHSLKVLTEYFRIQAERNVLDIPDPKEAAYHFSALLMHRWLPAKLYGDARMPEKRVINQAVNSAVKAFMQIYGKQ